MHLNAKNEMLDAALAYAAYGMAVLPVAPHGKNPLTAHGVKDATRAVEKIINWWTEFPTANVGVATGSISKFWVLDVDGEDGEASLVSLEQQYGPLPSTVEVITANGRHLYFEMAPKSTLANSVKKIAGIDVRGDNGYVIAPPSVHKTGKRYAWSVDCGETISSTPKWLLDIIQQSVKKSETTPVSEWRDLVKGVTEGERNSSIARIAGKLLRSRIDPYVALELCLSWNEARCKPPLHHQEVARTVNSIAGIELNRRERKT